MLENTQINDKKAVEFFENKITNKMLYSDIHRASTFPTDAILFNIDSKSNSDGKTKKNSIVDVFMKVFNEKLGYCSQIPWLADIERILDEEGNFEKFKAEYQSITNETWEEGRDKAYFIRDEFVAALKATKGLSQESAEQLFDKAEDNCAISPENFANLVKKYLDKKGKNHRLIFLVDEVGQYIGSNTDLMLNLQTIVENLGTTCKGRAWVLVTSQEAIDSLTKERFQDQDFSKIQGRFNTLLNLSSSNTDEVIKKRLLDKKPIAEQSLAAHYENEEAILRNLITFSSNTAGMKSFNSSSDFIETYPFVPYQFNLLQKVFESIRKFSHAGKHLSEGERSMLNAFHTSLINFADKEITDLVPFNAFYSTVETFLDGSIKRIFDRAETDHADIESFDVDVLKVLFMIKYIKEVPADLENIATLMISNMNQSKNKLKAKIESSLTRLKKATLIQQNGDNYDFLTDEEQDINRGIKQVQIDYRDIINSVYDNIFREIYTKPSYSFGKYNNYYVSKYVDDICQGKKGEDLEIKFITSQNAIYNLDESRFKLLTAEGSVLLIKLPSDNTYLSEIENVIKTLKYINQKSDIKMSENQRKIVSAKGDEVIQRKTRIKELIAEAILKSEFYANSEKLTVDGTDAVTVINKCLEVLAKNTFHKLPMIKNNIQTDRDILNILNNPQQLLIGGNEQAQKELFTVISQRSEMNINTTLQDLKTRFAKKPYGWASIDISGVLASLFQQNEIKLFYNGEELTVDNREVPKYLTNERELTNVTIRVKTQIDTALIDSAKNLARDIFEKQTLKEDGELLANQIKEELISEQLNHIKELQYKQTGAYPGGEVTEIGQKLFKKLQGQKDANLFLQEFTESEQLLRVWKAEFRLVKGFFDGQQKVIFDNGLKAINLYEKNTYYLKDEEIKVIYTDLNSIITDNKPYSRIKDIPQAVEKFNQIFDTLLSGERQISGRAISENGAFIESEAKNYGLNSAKYISKYAYLSQELERLTSFNDIIAVRDKASKMAQDIVESMKIEVHKLHAEQLKQQQAQTAEPDPTAEGITIVSPVITAVPKVKEIVYVNPSEFYKKSETIETDQEVDSYLKELEKQLKQCISENKRIKIV